MAALPSLPQSLSENIAGLLQQSELSSEAIRTKVKEAQRLTAENYQQYAAIVAKINEDAIGLLRAGAKIDVQTLIDSALGVERDAARQLEISEKNLNEVLRRVAKKRPDLLASLNEAMSAELSDIERMATLSRDMRWRLMEARAKYQPSEGIGPITGMHSEIEGS